MKKILAFAIGLILAIVFAISYGQVSNDVLTWQRPTTRVDGSPLAASEILQYEIHSAKVCSGTYALLTTAAGNLETFTRSTRPAGRECYKILTVDTAGLRSALTDFVFTEKCPLGQRVTVAGGCALLALPERPTNLQAT